MTALVRPISGGECYDCSSKNPRVSTEVKRRMGLIRSFINYVSGVVSQLILEFGGVDWVSSSVTT